MHMPHISEDLKHHLMLGGFGAAIVVAGVILYRHATGGNLSDALGIDPNSLNGGGNKLGFLSKILGAGGGNLPFNFGALPLPGGNDGPGANGSGTDYVSLSTNSTGSGDSSPFVQNFFAALANSVAPTSTTPPAGADSSNVHIDQVIAQEAATLPEYGPRPEIGGYGDGPQPGIFAAGINPDTGNPINPLTGGDVTPQDLSNLGQNAGAAYYDPTATQDNNAAQFYSQPGNVDANGQSWIGGSPPTT